MPEVFQQSHPIVFSNRMALKTTIPVFFKKTGIFFPSIHTNHKIKKFSNHKIVQVLFTGMVFYNPRLRLKNHLFGNIRRQIGNPLEIAADAE